MIKNMNRKTNGLFLGMAGSGKTTLIQDEIECLLKTKDNANVYVINVGRDYEDFADEKNGAIIRVDNTENFINPFDVCLLKNELNLDDDIVWKNVLSNKFDFICSIFEDMSDKELTRSQVNALEHSLVDVYDKFIAHSRSSFNVDMSFCPTIDDLYRLLKNGGNAYDTLASIIKKNPEKAAYLSHKTNIPHPYTNLFYYEVSYLDNSTLEYYLCLSDVWNRAKASSRNGIKNYIYLEDMAYILKNKRMSDVLASLWKTAKKYDITLIGSVQSAELLGRRSSGILLNTPNIYMLTQAPISAHFLKEQFAFNEEQMKKLMNMHPGKGLVIDCGEIYDL